jgi:hypothetical protein
VDIPESSTPITGLRVRRKITPWGLRLRGGTLKDVAGEAFDASADSAEFADVPILAFIPLIFFVIFVILAFPIFVVFLIELVLSVFIFAFLFTMRAVRKQPWPIQMKDYNKNIHGVWLAPSWRSAGRWAKYMRAELKNGRRFPLGDEVLPKFPPVQQQT